MLRTLCNKLLRENKNYINRIQRNITVTSNALGRAKTYEGEGKTTVQILNNEADLGVMINGISQCGFRLNNDVTILGPMLIFPRSVLSWNIESANDITEESLALFSVLEPKADILVVGVGDPIKDASIFRQLLPISKKLKLNMEILATEQACSTFNFLNSEGRFVVGAMIPPQTLVASDDDILQTKLRYQNIYEIDEPFKL